MRRGRRTVPRGVWCAGAVLASALAAAGCGSASGSAAKSAPSAKSAHQATRTLASAGAGGQRGGNLVIARSSDTLSLDPTQVVDNESLWIQENLYDTLYTPRKDGKGVMPALATSYTLSHDKKTWTFHLRKGVRFNNGKPMTSADVKYSLDRARKSKGGFGYIDAAIKSIATPSKSTVVVHTKYPWAPFLADIAIITNGIVPKNLDGKSPGDFFKHPVTTGPFKLDHWTKGQELKVVRNPYYWQKGKPYLDSVTWTVVADDNTRILQLKGGQAQVDEGPPFSAVASLKATPGIEMALFPSTRTDYILMNERVKPYQDVHVRRAIAYALNRDAMVKAVLFGNGSPANSFMPPQVPYYDKHTQTPKFDLAKAKQELAKSSVPHGFSTQFLVGGSDVFYSSIAEIVQQQLKPLGINVTLKKIDPANLFNEQQSFHYQMSIDYWTMDIADPDEIASFFLDPKGGGSSDYYTDFSNAKIVSWVHAAQSQFNTTKRQALYSKAQAAAAQELPQIPLFYSPFRWAFSDKVQGFEVFPTGNYHLEDVWLKK